MKECFQDCRIGPDRLEIIESANAVIERYQAMGYTLTLRQLYYQFVGNKLFPDTWIDEAYNLKNGLQPDTKNTVKNYKRLGEIIGVGRLAGLIDWDAIEDRGRQPHRHPQWNNLDELVDAALFSYRLDRWVDQPCYVELWCEKDALSGVLEPVADEFHVHFMANKGYSSLSAMREAAKRFSLGCGAGLSGLSMRRTPRRPGVILYLGDHDPSGEDMVRDIKDRMQMFLGWRPLRHNGKDLDMLQVLKVALTWDQIQEHNLPPDPAKLSDSRAKSYVEKYGEESWELDALPPNVLANMARDAIREFLDQDKMDAVIDREDLDKTRLREALESLEREE